MNNDESERALSPASHPIRRILSSRQPAMVLLKYLLVLVAFILGLTSLQVSLQSLVRPFVYHKDFIQEYLLAKAVLKGVDPFLPLPELALRFLGPLPNPVLQHPTPHPPAVAWLSLPLGLLSYEQAAVVWFLFEIVCIVAAIYLLLRWFGRRPGLALTLFTALLALGWNPFWEELITGQLMTLLLLLLIGAWLAFRSGDEITGGVLFGLSIALKLVAWPIIIFLAIRRNWRAVIAAGAAGLVANLAAALLMGFERVLYYYLEVGTKVSSLYHASDYNFSLWTIGWRAFEGTGSPVVTGATADPLVAAPGAARLVSFGIPLAMLGVGLVWALRARSFDVSFGILICVSILVSPVAWRHYLVLASIPVVVAGRRLRVLDWPRWETNVGLTLGLLLFITRSQLDRIIRVLSGHEPIVGTAPKVPFAVTLLSFVPTVAILGLLYFLRHLDRMSPEEAPQGQPNGRVLG